MDRLFTIQSSDMLSTNIDFCCRSCYKWIQEVNICSIDDRSRDRTGRGTKSIQPEASSAPRHEGRSKAQATDCPPLATSQNSRYWNQSKKTSLMCNYFAWEGRDSNWLQGYPLQNHLLCSCKKPAISPPAHLHLLIKRLVPSVNLFPFLYGPQIHRSASILILVLREQESGDAQPGLELQLIFMMLGYLLELSVPQFPWGNGNNNNASHTGLFREFNELMTLIKCLEQYLAYGLALTRSIIGLYILIYIIRMYIILVIEYNSQVWLQREHKTQDVDNNLHLPVCFSPFYPHLSTIDVTTDLTSALSYI